VDVVSTVRRALQALGAARGPRTVAAREAAERELWRRATEVDFAVASTIDRARVRLLKPRHGVEDLTRRLETHVQTLDEISRDLPADAARELDARKEHATWLLTELRRI
jgi:hypothetical protein